MVMFTPGALDRDPRLGHALRRVRARYSLRVLLRGLAILAVGAILGVAFAAYGLDAFRYSRGAVVSIRALLYLWIASLTLRFVGRPIWRGRRLTSDTAIARYIEEHEPSLDAALRSAVDPVAPAEGHEPRSTALQNLLVDDVVTRLAALDLARQVDRSEIRQAATALGTAALAGIAFFLLAPAFVRQAFPYLFDPFSHSGQKATPYGVLVSPGNHTIARGSDQEISARLTGFDGAAELVSRSTQSAWTRLPMIREETGDGISHKVIVLSVQNPIEYFVESSGTRSDVFRLDVVDRPYVRKIDLEYHLPSYTKTEPQRVEGTGDIATLSGTSVRLAITSTVPVSAGRLIVQGRESSPIPLAVAPSGVALSGEMRVLENGFYKIELKGADGVFVVGSPDYVIETVQDLPPRLAFDRPGRDTQATPIEEVFTQVKAEDDFGVARMDLVYSLNGGPETVVPLHDAPVLKEVVASHTFFLEEMSMKPGDVISYYARATDVGAPSRQATTDIYFLEARPYRRDFRQAEQAGGGGGGGGSDAGSLSQQQRQVIAATFRLAREQATNSRESKSLAQDAQTVGLIQGRLRTQVESLVTRMLSRGALPEGSPMHGTADELRQAITKMSDAESELKASRPKEALPSEQSALAHLQRAEASFRDVSVSFGGGGGGGGGQSNASAEELADLYQLDLDKLRNQYETLQSGAREQRNQQVDEALSRLQELARRQEQENERARQGARAPNQSGGSGGAASQRQLADETEELGRRLERLTRENPSPALEESARRLREAAATMRQQASASRGQSPGAPRDGETPLDRLREARRLLDSDRSTRLDRDLSGFREKAEALKRSQESIAGEMHEQARDQRPQGGSSSTPGGSTKTDRLMDRKDALASDVADLESRLDKVAGEARREQKETARKLQEAANGIRDSKLKEKIRYTKGLLDRPTDAEAFETDIAASIEALGKQIGDAQKSLGVPPEKKRAAALERARSLSLSLDSMQERLKAKGPSPSSTGPGGMGGGGRGRLGQEETRQLRREFAERSQDAEAFKRALEESGASSAQASTLAQRLRGLATDRNFKDPLGLAELTGQIAADIKMIEYVLRREADGERPALQLSGSEELPPGYRAMVEEYYRTLARKPRK